MWTTVARVFATTLPYDGRYRCLKVRTGPSAARPTGLVAERARTLRALASRDARRASRRLLDRLALAESPVSSSSRLLVQDAWAGLRGLARCPLAYRSAAPLAGARDEAHRQAPLPALGGGASLRRLSRRVYAAIDAIGRTARRHGCAPLTVRPRARLDAVGHVCALLAWAHGEVFGGMCGTAYVSLLSLSSEECL